MMKAAVLEEYRKFVWKDQPKPEVSDDEVLVKVKFAGICGSDQHIFMGEFHPRTPIPFTPGHEFGGVIEALGAKAKKFSIGDKVTVDPIIWCGTCPACQRQHYPACTSLKLVGVDLDGGFGEYVKVPESMIYKVDSRIPDEHVALIEVLSIGFHACNRAEVKKDDTVVIYGAGKVGQCILQAVRTKTTNTLIMVDVMDERLAIGKKAYPEIHVINSHTEDPITKIKEITEGKGVDIAFEAIGHFQEIPDRVNPVRGCIQSIRGAGKVCVLGLSDEPEPIIFKEMIWKEASIVASRVSHGEFNETIEHLEKGTLKPEVLITDILDASQVQQGFEMLEQEPEKHLKILLRL